MFRAGRRSWVRWSALALVAGTIAGCGGGTAETSLLLTFENPSGGTDAGTSETPTADVVTTEMNPAEVGGDTTDVAPDVAMDLPADLPPDLPPDAPPPTIFEDG